MAKPKEVSPDDAAANDQPKSSTQEKREVNQSKESETTLSKKFSSPEAAFEEFQAAVEKEISEHGDDEKLKLIKKQVKKVRSSLQQYEKQRQMDKKSSFSQEPQPREMSRNWQEQIEKHILVSPMISNLNISYDFLPLHSKLSLLRLAVFPEKATIKKRPLIYWLTGEGLATKSVKKTAREAGEEIFRDLLCKYLVQPWYKSNTTPKPLINFFTLNPWIRRMLISKAKQAEFFDFDEMGRITNNFSRTRCLCLAKDNDWSSTNSNDFKELQTIYNVNESSLNFRDQFLLGAKKLRVLQFGRWQASPYHHIEVENERFLQELGVLKHLKYLSLRGISRITSLPSSIVDCRNLEILDVKACHNLETLPSNVSSLKKLTHLDMSECHLLESMPYGLGSLSSLQVLKGFVLEAEESPGLEDLARLEKLEKLSLVVTRKAGFDSANWNLSALSRSDVLKNLTITWRMDDKAEKDEPLPEEERYYAFTDKLEKVDLRCYPHRELSYWLSPAFLKNLKRLYIRGGKLEKLFREDDFPDKWEVEILRLKYLKNFDLEASGLPEKFPEAAGQPEMFPRLVHFPLPLCCNINSLYYQRTELL